MVGSTLHFYFYVTSKQHSELRDIQIDTWAPRLAGSRLPLFMDGKVLERAIPHLQHRIYIKWKIISSVVLCPTNITHSSTLYKLTSRLAGWLAKKNPRSSVIYKLTDEAYNQEPSKLADRIPGCCFLCPPTSHFFPTIYLGRKMGYLLQI